MAKRAGSFFTKKIFPFIFILMGLGIIIAGLRNMAHAYSSTQWPNVEGTISKSQIRKSLAYSSKGGGNRRTNYHADIEYQFSVDGKAYVGNKITLEDSGNSDRSHAKKIIDAYPKQKIVQIYYKASNPKLAVIEPGIRGIAWFIPIIGLVFFVPGLFIYIKFNSTFKQDLQFGRDSEFETENKQKHSNKSESHNLLVENIARTSISKGLASYKSCQIIELTPQRLKFGRSFKMILNSLILGTVGVVIVYYLASKSMIALVLGLTFILLGFFPIFKRNEIVFDKSANLLLKNQKKKKAFGGRSRKQVGIRLDEIRAIQLLSVNTSIASKRQDFCLFEINLVLDDYERVNLFGYGSGNSYRQDAQKIADFLDVPFIDHAGS